MQLRENCFKRVRQDRTRLLWKCRLDSSRPELDIVLRDIVSDELNKMNNDDPIKDDDKDVLWDDDKVPHTTYQYQEGDCEDILLEMQNLFYQDLNSPPDTSWEDQVDDYLARAVYDHMHLNADNNNNKVSYLSI